MPRFLGRKRKTSKREDSVVVRKSKSNRFKTAPQIKAEMQIEHGVNISVSTTRRRLREAGLKGCKLGRSLGLLLAIRSVAYSSHKHTNIGHLNNGPE